MDAIVDAVRQSDAVSDAAWKSSTTD